MRPGLKKTTLATLFVASQFMLGRLVAQTNPNTKPTNQKPAGISASPVATTPSALGTPSTILPDSLMRNFVGYNTFHLPKQYEEDKTIAMVIDHPNNRDDGFTLKTYVTPLADNPLYDKIAFAHLSFTANGQTLRHALMSQDYYVIPGVDFWNPKDGHKIKNQFHLNFVVGKDDFDNVVNKNDYTTILDSIERNIKNNEVVVFTGGASRTHDSTSTPGQATLDSLNNVRLASNRAHKLEGKVRADLVQRGYSPHILDKLLKITVDSHGDQNLIVDKTGPLIENQCVIIDLSGQKPQKYPYHILMIDPETASEAAALFGRTEQRYGKGEGFYVNCVDDMRNVELGNQVRLIDMQSFKSTAVIDVHSKDLSKLTVAVDGTKGLTDGEFTLSYTSGSNLTLNFNQRPVLLINNVEPDSNGITTHPVRMDKNPYFVISDPNGNYHPIRFNEQLSYYLPSVVSRPMADHATTMGPLLTSSLKPRLSTHAL